MLHTHTHSQFDRSIALAKIRTHQTSNVEHSFFSLSLSAYLFVVELPNYVIFIVNVEKLQPTKKWKNDRVRGREETETSGIEQCTVYMNMGLWMFCKDLARLFLFIIHFVFGLFVAVVTINKPIYDIIEILLFNHSISYHMKARLESVYSSTFARKMKKKKRTEPTADLYRLCYQSFFCFSQFQNC